MRDRVAGLCRRLAARLRRVRAARMAERVRSTPWVIPTVMSAALALAACAACGTGPADGPWWARLEYRGKADQAQDVLALAATFALTCATAIYSITFVVLALGSVQFSPRIIRRFIYSLKTQALLGAFPATFAYCLAVLVYVRGWHAGADAPGLAVSGAVALAAACVGTLIYLVAHFAYAINAGNIIATIAAETVREVERTYDARGRGGEPVPANPPKDAADGWSPVRAGRSGYLQEIDYDGLRRAADWHACQVWVKPVVGNFVAVGHVLARYRPRPGRELAPGRRRELEAELCGGFVLGKYRTLEHDVAFGVRQIVDIGVKAISPAVNDPTTAVNGIHWLAVILAALSGREDFDRRHRRRGPDDPLFAHRVRFKDLVREAVGPLLHFGAGDPVIVRRLIGAVAAVLEPLRGDAAAAGYRTVLYDCLTDIAAAYRASGMVEFEKARCGAALWAGVDEFEFAEHLLTRPGDAPPPAAGA